MEADAIVNTDATSNCTAPSVTATPSSNNTSSINGKLEDTSSTSSSLPPSPSKTIVTASVVDSDAVTVTLREIQNAVPQESQGESFVMDHIEQISEDDDHIYDGDDGLRTDRGSSPSLVLDQTTSLPVILIESMQEDKRRQHQHHRRQKTCESHISNMSGMTNNSRIRSASSISRSVKPKTIEEELFELTNDFNNHRNNNNNNNRIDNNDDNDTISEGVDDTLADQEVEKDEEEELLPLTQAEKFANNANQIMENNVTATDSDLEEQQQGGSSSSRPSSIRKNNAYRKDKDHWQNIKEIKRIIYTNRKTILRYVRGVMFYVILPATFVALLLCYAFNNPQFETAADVRNNRAIDSLNLTTTKTVNPDRPSWSWLVMFFGVRQVITFSTALGIQCLVITYYQQPGLKFNIIGPMTQLFIIRSGGIPLVLIFWGILNLILLHGTDKFTNHWMFYSRLKILNAENPSGLFPANTSYGLILFLMIGAGVAISVKRFLIGLRFGQNSYHRYANRLAKVLKQMLKISKLARLSELKNELGKDTEHAETKRASVIEDSIEVDLWLQTNLYDTGDTSSINKNNNDQTNKGALDTSFDENSNGSQPAHNVNELLMSLHLGRNPDGSIKINEMLGEWEEIELADRRKEIPSLSAIVQFGSSLGLLKSGYPFGQYFGYCPTRYDSVECSQDIYSNLLDVQNHVASSQLIPSGKSNRSTSNDESKPDASLTLKFHTIALIAIDKTGDLDTDQVKQLMRLFRPTREGDISLIDFCKSIDFVYKEIRKLRASVANEGVMNAAAERLIDFLFYCALIILALAAVGIDIIFLFGSVSTVVISFSFCVGGASSDVIKGLLFILLQRPYDIGDMIAIGQPTDTAAGTGSPQWTVTDLTLYHTRILYGSSLESATISNGSMANLRIINGARSPRAQLQFYMKFGVSVKPETIEEFKKRLFDHIRSKPREWLRPQAFRLSRIAADLGYVEYFILLQHRESWQQIACLLDSLSDVQQFSFELSTTLGMDYRSPALPIHFDSAATTRAVEQSVARSMFGNQFTPTTRNAAAPIDTTMNGNEYPITTGDFTMQFN